MTKSSVFNVCKLWRSGSPPLREPLTEGGKCLRFDVILKIAVGTT